ncbi:unnamed protein product [Didymodactylos carnosus]|uniref:Uncharacterized protein n=1 Tax=Didymodactylos carnosus TaxID=1234261 RepID=A0A8S2KLF5_9BILA|nr:unnamed protein product [Didymodactylos carnosus]CAF3857668.1 unnamed protein product [Didymodactylos carnosus]
MFLGRATAKKMLEWKRLLILIPSLYGICIFLLTFCFLTNGFHQIDLNICQTLKSFNYTHTYVEILFVVLLDSLLFIALPLLLFIKPRQKLAYLLRRYHIVFTLFQLVIYGYSLTKFLIYYEYTNIKISPQQLPKQFTKWDFLTVGFVSFSSLLGIAVWHILFSIIKQSYPTVTESEQVDTERQRLINHDVVSRSYVEENTTQTSNDTSENVNNNVNLSEKVKETTGSWFRIMKVGLPEWRLYCLGFLCLLIAAACEVFLPLYSGKIINSVVTDHNIQAFKIDLIWYLGLSVAYVIASGVRGFLFTITMTNLAQRLRNQLFSRIMAQDIQFFDETKTGDITSRLTSDISTVSESISVNFNVFLRSTVKAVEVSNEAAVIAEDDAVVVSLIDELDEFFIDTEVDVRVYSLIVLSELEHENDDEEVSIVDVAFQHHPVQLGTVVMMLYLSWSLFILSLITGPLCFGTAKLYGNLMETQQKKIQDALAKSNSLAEEAISTVRTVKSFANENEEARLFSKQNDVVRQLTIKQAFYYFAYMWNGQILSVALSLGSLAFGGHLVLNNKLSGQNFVSFLLYQMSLADILDNINNVYTGLMKASGASAKVFEYIDRKPKTVNNGTYKPDQFEGKIEFKNVTFSFPNRKEDAVLKNVSFTVEPGQQVALVGPSGSGKTTCISLLEHFYDTDAGEILVDSIPIDQYDYKYYHQKISLVSQEPVLHARSIKDNIQYGMDEPVSQQEIERISLMANAHMFISDFAKGYETEAGERGQQMAGGQKQRVSIARALIRQPKILLLDEATSALDAEAEAQVQDAISRTVIGRTVLIIAHRLSTIRNADKIIVIHHGKIVDEGTHYQLIAKRGLYYDLVKRQTEMYEEDKRTKSSENSLTKKTTNLPITSKQQSTFSMNVSV